MLTTPAPSQPEEAAANGDADTSNYVHHIVNLKVRGAGWPADIAKHTALQAVTGRKSQEQCGNEGGVYSYAHTLNKPAGHVRDRQIGSTPLKFDRMPKRWEKTENFEGKEGEVNKTDVPMGVKGSVHWNIK